MRCCATVRDTRTVPQMVTITEEVHALDGIHKDESFYKILLDSFHGHICSSVYLVGDGFDGDWMKMSLSYMCKGRRAFIGKNLYSKGACYAAIVREQKNPWPYVYMGDNEMKVNVSLKVKNRGKWEFLSLINAGDNWYEASGDCEVLLDGDKEIDFWLQLPHSRDARIEKLELSDLPERKPKTTRLRISAKPVSDSKVKIKIRDLGFGEIVRLTLQNWNSVTGGPRGVSDIPRPGFFGMSMDITASTIYIYYLVLAAVVVTIVVITRLKNSRVGLALQALREDEIACEAMGVDITRVKLSAFALGSCWAGFAGVIFAAKTTYINPSSFTFMESAMILSMVVLGGMGSIAGVVIAALILILAPEYLRAFSDYRMLLFGAIMVIMMLFRPQGLISGERRRYRISNLHGAEGGRS